MRSDWSVIEFQAARLAALEADNARLREALTTIELTAGASSHPHCRNVSEIARQALKEAP